MTDERRYGDDEVAAIFEAAAAADRPAHRRARSSEEGLTLAELQAIGREVGVAPERIAEAATALDQRPSTPVRRSNLGMPIAVGRSVDLPRAPTDREWEVLLAELRATFRASGREASRGDHREWRNGNLHAYIEPTDSGYRLRLGTLKGDAAGINRLGAVGLLAGLVFLMILLLTEQPNDLFAPAVIAGLSAAALAYNAVRLPRWALEREEQMDYIAARARALIAGSPDPEPDADG